MENNRPAKPIRRKIPLWVKLLFIISILGACYALYEGGVNQSDVEQAIENQLETLKGKQYTEAYYKYTTKGFQDSISLEQFKKYLEQYPALGNSSVIDIVDESAQEDVQVIKALIKSEKGESVEVEYKLQQVEGEWKISGMRMIPEETPAEKSQITAEEDIEKPIRGQLSNLRKHYLNKAYQNYTTSHFQQTISLEQFRTLVEQNAILKEFDIEEISPPTVKDGVAQVSVKLLKGAQEGILEFDLEEKDGVWKINNLQIVSKKDDFPKDINIQELVQYVSAQAKAIRAKNVKDAYYNFTHPSFKKATSFDDFDKFVKANTVFHDNKSANFTHAFYNNNIVTLSGTISDREGHTRDVDYELLKDGDNWKILNIQIYDAEPLEEAKPPRPPTALTFNKINIGTKTNAEGDVQESSNLLSHDQVQKDKIYATVFFDQGFMGDKVEIVFEFTDLKAQIPAISHVLEQSGSTQLTFHFTPPHAGWPKGNYRIIASSDAGKEKSFPFSIQ